MGKEGGIAVSVIWFLQKSRVSKVITVITFELQVKEQKCESLALTNAGLASLGQF